MTPKLENPKTHAKNMQCVSGLSHAFNVSYDLGHDQVVLKSFIGK